MIRGTRRSLHPLVALVSIGGLLFASPTPARMQVGEKDTKLWGVSSFTDLRQGTLADAGANTYIAADGSVRLVNLWDFNGDGNFDIPATCPQDYTETPDLFVYWSGREGFSAARRSALPAEGSVAGKAADLNSDGFPELIVCNRFDGEKNNLDSYIYWGGKDGFSETRRSGLPTEAAEDAAVADLDRDGLPDIVFANRGIDYHMSADFRQRSFVYFGARAGYGPARKLELPTVAATGVELADVSGDGYTDILFSMEGNRADDGGAMVYFNDGKGRFSPKRHLFLPGLSSSDVAVGDLNRDGHPDIVLASMFRLKEKQHPGLRQVIDTLDVESYVYWGGAKGYSTANRSGLPMSHAASVTLADLNADNLIDIVFTGGRSSRPDARRDGYSLIYWNGRDGFLATHRTELETNTALDCAAADLNGDGYPELVFANEQLSGSLNIDSYIYWGGREGFSSQRRSGLPTHGASGVVLSDLNRDGLTDIAFMNKKEGFEIPRALYVYPGDDRGEFSADRRWVLPGRTDDAYVVADMNADGFSDLLFFASDARIYWGGSSGLSSDRSSPLKIPYNGNIAAAADLNRDGFLDLVVTGNQSTFALYGNADGLLAPRLEVLDERSRNLFSGYLQVADLNRDGWLDVVVTLADQDALLLCWNSPTGFAASRTSTVEADNPCGVRIADLNRDGHLDIVAVSEVNLKKRPSDRRPLYVGDARTSMRVFWGGHGDYSPKRMTKLPTVGADDCTIADLNGDGWLDIAVTSYHSGDHRHHPGYLYWNGPGGFQANRRDLIPMNAGCGIFAGDLNLDGFKDLVWANHTIVGNHRSHVSVAYGSAAGPRLTEAIKLPATGPHYFNFTDIGNIFDRSPRFDYISPAFDAGPGARLERLSWEADTPSRTGVELQIRTAPTREALEKAPWTGPGSAGDHYRRSGEAIGPRPSGHRWVQYKAGLTSANQARSPVLKSVSIEFSNATAQSPAQGHSGRQGR